MSFKYQSSSFWSAPFLLCHCSVATMVAVRLHRDWFMRMLIQYTECAVEVVFCVSS
uniref:Uncharacterized protein n=1 Tax=Arundo donax TaxID=35708 RepID=A0A0A9CR79_ARUDO